MGGRSEFLMDLGADYLADYVAEAVAEAVAGAVAGIVTEAEVVAVMMIRKVAS